MRIKYVLAVTAVLVSIVLAGCSQAASENLVSKTPAAVDNASGIVPVVAENNSVTAAPIIAELPVVKIGDILTDPKAYDGKKLVVQGKISRECPSGCWFNLQDGNAVIYIDLAANNMVIPQKTGSTARVTALVVREGNDVYLVGSKVEF